MLWCGDGKKTIACPGEQTAQGDSRHDIFTHRTVAFAAALLVSPGSAARADKPHRRHADDAAEHRAHAGAIANDLGLFKKYGLDVKIIELDGGVYTYRAMVAGSADVALASGAVLDRRQAKGAPTKIILANAPKLEASMVVNENIKTLEDLKGKRIGIQEPGGFADVLAAACCAPPRSTRRTSTSSASPRRTCRRWSPTRSTPRSCMSSRR